MLTKTIINSSVGKGRRLQTCELDELSVFAALEAFWHKIPTCVFPILISSRNAAS